MEMEEYLYARYDQRQNEAQKQKRNQSILNFLYALIMIIPVTLVSGYLFKKEITQTIQHVLNNSHINIGNINVGNLVGVSLKHMNGSGVVKKIDPTNDIILVDVYFYNEIGSYKMKGGLEDREILTEVESYDGTILYGSFAGPIKPPDPKDERYDKDGFKTINFSIFQDRRINPLEVSVSRKDLRLISEQANILNIAQEYLKLFKQNDRIVVKTQINGQLFSVAYATLLSINTVSQDINVRIDSVCNSVINGGIETLLGPYLPDGKTIIIDYETFYKYCSLRESK